MFNLAKLRERRENGDKGFTLIELLVVVVIIGILVAIAIPLYLNYKKGAADKSAESDLRGGISTLELCQTDNGSYPEKAFQLSDASDTKTVCETQKINTSAGTVLTYSPVGTDAYVLVGWNTNGTTTSSKFYCYSSSDGGSIVTSTDLETAKKGSCSRG